MIFADLLRGNWGTLLGNGMTAGCLTAILLTAFMELTAPRRRRLETELALASTSGIDKFHRASPRKTAGTNPPRGACALLEKRTLTVLMQQARRCNCQGTAADSHRPFR